MTQHIVILVFEATTLNAFITAKLDELSNPLKIKSGLNLTY